MKELPKSWRATELDNLLTFILGGDWGKAPDFDDPDYVEVKCIRASEIKNWDTEKGLTAANRKIKKNSLQSRELRENDIIVEISGGGPEQPVGRTVLIEKTVLSQDPELPKVCTNFFRLIRPSEEINSTYLNYFLQHFYKSGEVRKYQGGSNNLRNLKFNDYIQITIPVSPLNEQKRIVAKIEALFSELDKGIENLKTAREQLKVYRQAVLKHAFEGKLTADWREENKDKLETADELLERIKQEREAAYQQQLEEWHAAVKAWEQNGSKGKKPTKPKKQKVTPSPTDDELRFFTQLPATWKWVKLGELVWSVKDGPHYTPKYSDKGIPFISGGNVRPNGVDFENVKYISKELHQELSTRCKPDVGDILYTKGGTTGIARVNTYKFDFNVWVHVAVLKLTKSLPPFYIQHALNSPNCYAQSQKYTHGVGNQDLGLTRMVNIILPICSKAEQKQIIAIFEKLTSEFDEVERIIDDELQKSEALRQSILKQAFSGKLVAQDSNDEPASVLLERIKAEKEGNKKKRNAA